MRISPCEARSNALHPWPSWLPSCLFELYREASPKIVHAAKIPRFCRVSGRGGATALTDSASHPLLYLAVFGASLEKIYGGLRPVGVTLPYSGANVYKRPSRPYRCRAAIF